MIDPVPYFSGDGAEHPAEVMRLIGYHAVARSGGILNPTDLKVSQYTVAGAGVNVAPGAFAAIQRAPNQRDQAYAGRVLSTEPTPVPNNGAAGVRYDLVMIRVEDWSVDAQWPVPAGNKATAPRVFTRTITGVSSSVITNEVTAAAYIKAAGWTGEALAGLTVPVNTATITGAMIKDLRRVGNPRVQREREHKASTSDDTLNIGPGTFEQFPNGVWFPVDLPEWAVKVKVMAFVEGLRLMKAGFGSLRVGINAQPTLATTGTNINEAQYISGAYDRRSYNLGGTINIPASLRGTRVLFELQGSIGAASSSGFLATDPSSSGMIDLVIEEAAA